MPGSAISNVSVVIWNDEGQDLLLLSNIDEWLLVSTEIAVWICSICHHTKYPELISPGLKGFLEECNSHIC